MSPLHATAVTQVAVTRGSRDWRRASCRAVSSASIFPPPVSSVRESTMIAFTGAA